MIARDSRFIDVAHLLIDPNYVRHVITNFVSNGYDPATAKVRMGITGTGAAPNYKIEEPSFPKALQIGPIEPAFKATPARIFNGRFHTEMTGLYDLERKDDNWSSDTMSLADLRRLHASLARSWRVH